MRTDSPTVNSEVCPAPHWFAATTRSALLDFWTVYDNNYERINEITMLSAIDHPEFGPIIRAMSPEVRIAQAQQSRQQLRQAMEGDWTTYEVTLRMQGAAYAQLGVTFSGWYDVVRAFERELAPLLVAAYAMDPTRLANALVAEREFIDRVMALIADEYLDTKQRMLDKHRETAGRNQEANRLKSEFLANMSHELRTPLNSILGFTSLLYDDQVPPDSAEHKEFLGDILRSGRHLLQLINDILDLSKVEAGKMEFHPEPVDLRLVVIEVVAIIRTTAAAKGIRVEVTVDPSLTGIVIDPARLKQVLYNYLSNAIKFTEDNGQVVVRVTPEGERSFRIAVEDSGVGIAPQDLNRLFVEFQQLDAGTGKRHGGTGLGLALTKRLVEVQGGVVGVDSVVGKGSTFYAVLPRQAETAESAKAELTRVVPAQGGLSVLVVEDQAHDRDTIVSVLTEAGHGFEWVGSGAQAVARCRERAFDAITLDLLLPDMSGLEVLRTIRATGKNTETPVIVGTVVAEKHALAGFSVQDILTKPIDRLELLAALQRAGLRNGVRARGM